MRGFSDDIVITLMYQEEAELCFYPSSWIANPGDCFLFAFLPMLPNISLRGSSDYSLSTKH